MKLPAFLTPAIETELAQHPFVICDVGAAGGIYSLFAGSRGPWKAHGFEPMPDSMAHLRRLYAGSGQVTLHDVALTDHDGEATFTIFTDYPTSSSLLDNHLVQEAGTADRREIKVTCRTLDGMVRDGCAAPDFIKLDTEGSELSVLKGGGHMVGSECLGVVSEIKFLPFSDRTTTLADMDIFLRDKGFVLFDIQTARCSRSVGDRFGGKKGALDSAYVLYLRNFYHLYADHLAGDPATARVKLLKMVVLAARFLYLDYAAELVDFGRSENLLTAAEATELFAVVCGCHDLSWRIPNFPGKARLALVLDWLSYMLQPEMKLAVPPMFNNLGNRRSALIRRKVPATARLLYPVRASRDPAKLDLSFPTD